ncbi:hypothetical protein EVJ58_g8991 [Rhodofomes roseus]|uniref:C2H2-type domain-containing protein n=1 Tax=Rhodofomes roseus TaxID=34475 RepID=A0A4Y9XVP9_9APHY|nr:hypothetical protein EVJ58_g8991 [Rhodofomes roseus]
MRQEAAPLVRREFAFDYSGDEHIRAPYIGPLDPSYRRGSPPTEALVPTSGYRTRLYSHGATSYGQTTGYGYTYLTLDVNTVDQAGNSTLDTNAYTAAQDHDSLRYGASVSTTNPPYVTLSANAPKGTIFIPLIPYRSTTWESWDTDPIHYGSVVNHAAHIDDQPSWHHPPSLQMATPYNIEAMPAYQGGYSEPHQVYLEDHHYANVSGPAMFPGPSVPPICRWDGCNTVLVDTTPSGVKRHLYDHHHLSRAECARGARGFCRWEFDGGVCGRPLDMNSYAKHVASVHLKSTARICDDCHSVIGRADSLTRHQRDHCTARRSW